MVEKQVLALFLIDMFLCLIMLTQMVITYRTDRKYEKRIRELEEENTIHIFTIANLRQANTDLTIENRRAKSTINFYKTMCETREK